MSIEVPPGRDLTLRFSILELGKDVLAVEYEAGNVSDSDLYVFNRLHRDVSDDGVFDLDPNVVYIAVEDSVVHLTKRVPDIPRGLLVEVPIVPCATLLRRGETLRETLSLSLPLRSFNPYRPQDQAVVTGFDSVVFSLGYFKVSEIGARPVNDVRTTQGTALHVYVTPWEQLVARTAAVSVSKAGPPPAGLTCPNCGAENPPASRFCSQCGARLVS